MHKGGKRGVGVQVEEKADEQGEWEPFGGL